MFNVKSTQSFTKSYDSHYADTEIYVFEVPGYNIFIRNLAIWNLELNHTEVQQVYKNEGW